MLDDFKQALLSLGVPVSHLEALKQKNRYIVWREVSTRTLRASGKVSQRAYLIAIDFFTKTEYDDLPSQLETALSGIDAAFEDSDIDYEADTGYRHYSWLAEVQDG